MNQFDKVVLVGLPWLFGLVLTLCGVVVSHVQPAQLHGVILTIGGIICFAIFCICSLLVKILLKK